VGQENIGHMASARAFDETQSALLDQGAHGLASGRGGEANAAGEPENGKTELELAFEASMAQEMIVDHALDEIEAEARHKIIFDLFADEESIEIFGFHGLIQCGNEKKKPTADS